MNRTGEAVSPLLFVRSDHAMTHREVPGGGGCEVLVPVEVVVVPPEVIVVVAVPLALTVIEPFISLGCK